MKFQNNINYDFDEFDKMLVETETFENNISIAKTVDNANRKKMNDKQLSQICDSFGL